MSTAGAPPSTIDDVITYVIALLVQCGEADYPHVDGSGLTEILIGERYLECEGNARRIVVIPDEPRGKLTGPLEIGARQVGAWVAHATWLVWGGETSDDRDRIRAARRIVHRLVNAFEAAGAARYDLVDIERLKETNIVTYGEEFRLTMTYAWQIPRDDAIEQAAAALRDGGGLGYGNSPPDPDRPNGDTGFDFATGNATLENDRP